MILYSHRLYAWLPDAEFVLLHAFEVELEGAFRFAGIDDAKIHLHRIQAREAAQESMEKFVERLNVPAARMTCQFVHEAPALLILEQELALDVDLVVVGKHGRSVMEDLLLSGVTKHVLAHSSCDMIIAGQAD